jgi:hypothetical protein
MAKYTSGRQKNLKIGISSYSENLTSLEVIGKVGIGTTNPLELLHVLGSTGAARFENTSNAYSVTINPQSSGPRVNFGSAGGSNFIEFGAFVGTNNLDTKGRDLKIYSTAVPSAFILRQDTGNIGIGTTNPQSALTVVGNVLVSGVSTLGITTATKLTAQQLNISGITTVGFLTATNISVSGVTTSNAYYIGTSQVISSARQLQNIASLDATTTATIETAIQQAPNDFTSLNISGISTLQSTTLIGGGTSTGTAGQILQVAGISSGAYIGGNLGVGNTNPQNTLDVGVGTIRLINKSSTGRFSQIYQDNNLIFSNSSTNDDFDWTNSTGSRMRLYGTGNLVIPGTFTPTGTASQRLQVDGGAYVSGSVGIGTTNPEKLLHLSTSVATPLIIQRTSNNNSAVEYRNTTSSMWAGIGGSANGWGVASSADVGIDAHILVTRTGGELLVGAATTTGTSSQKLQVTGGAYVSGNLGVGNTNGEGIKLFVSQGAPAANRPVALITDDGTIPTMTGGATLRISNDGSINSFSLLEAESSAGRLVFTNAGNLGIGTTNPGATLNVVPTSTSIAGLFSGTTSSDMVRITQFGTGNALVVEDETPEGSPFVVTGVGTVGIGITNPSIKLTVSGGLDSSNRQVRFVQSGAGDLYIKHANLVSSIETGSGVQLALGGNGAEVVRINSTGVGIGITNPTSKLHVVGDTYISGILTATDINSASDIRLKTNIKPFENTLEKIVHINGVSFNWIDSNAKSGGIIAQDVEKVFPELVNDGDHKTVNYNGLVGVLVESIKELKQEVEYLKSRLS